jgi:hypothetical protein
MCVHSKRKPEGAARFLPVESSEMAVLFVITGDRGNEKPRDIGLHLNHDLIIMEIPYVLV